MLGRVLARRTVAAADVAAPQAQAQVNPLRTSSQTLLASLGPRRNRFKSEFVFAEHDLVLKTRPPSILCYTVAVRGLDDCYHCRDVALAISSAPSLWETGVTLLNRTVLVFWAAWLSIVATTNVLDGLAALDVVPASFRFVSGNWRWINQVMDPLAVPRGTQAFLFVAAIVWEVVAAALFWWAAATYRGRPLSRERVTLCACGVNLTLWAAFQVLDEVFIAYQPEAVHRVIFVSQLVTLLLLHCSANVGEARGAG
jgi:hypothetical protein